MTMPKYYTKKKIHSLLDQIQLCLLSNVAKIYATELKKKSGQHLQLGMHSFIYSELFYYT